MANKKKTYERFGNFFCVHDEVKNKGTVNFFV